MKTVTQNTNYLAYSAHFFIQPYAHPVHNRCLFTGGNTLLYYLSFTADDITKHSINSLIPQTSKVSGVDISKDRFSSKELAAIIGVKPKQVKAYRILRGSDATQLWGIRGYNGVMEILSPAMYRQLKKQGNLENFRRAR